MKLNGFFQTHKLNVNKFELEMFFIHAKQKAKKKKGWLKLKCHC
jgi:hypothetical protein